MDALALMDELRGIAQTGLAYAQDPYDRERYERLMALVAEHYGEALDLPPAEVRARLARDVGYVTSKVGTDAAVFDLSGRILLTLRADDGRWGLPAGWVEPGEDPPEAAVRETWEETGYRVRVVRLVDVFSRKASATHMPHGMVAVCYLCEVVGGERRVSHESLDVRWWEIDEVPEWHGSHEQYARAAKAVAGPVL